MKLPVLPPDADPRPWYADGLQFTCTQCGNCCTGAPGYVWLTEQELARLADYLKLSAAETIRRYCRTINGRLSLRESRNEKGEYDCVFLTPLGEACGSEAGNGGAGNGVPAGTKWGCSIYPVRPLQCRTWPFWDGTLSSAQAWEVAARRCEGMNQGPHYTRQRVEALRDATRWPEDVPDAAPARDEDRGAGEGGEGGAGGEA